MILFSIAETFSKGKQTPIWQSGKKEHFLASKTSFFKFNMDALTVLSIWNTELAYIFSPI